MVGLVATLLRSSRAAIRKSFSASMVLRDIDVLPVIRRQTGYAIGRTFRVQSADRGAGRWRAARAKASARLFLGEPGLTDARVVPLMLAPSSAAQRAHEPNDWNWPFSTAPDIGLAVGNQG